MSSIVRKAGSHLLSGYSFLSSQYGLSVDNIAGYELVLPNGTIVDVTSKDEDLYFGLRVSRNFLIQLYVAKRLRFQGGMNNFVGYQFVTVANFVTC